MSPSEKELDRRLHIDRICDEFEALLQKGESPHIEDFLNRVEIADQSTLAEELAEVEVSVRSSRGEAVSKDDILKRLSQVIDPTIDIDPDQKDVRQGADSANDAKETERPEETAEAETRSGEQNFPSIEGFEIQAVLGRGGMGVVYKARQIELDRTVALKMIRAGQEADEQDIQRFHVEAEAAARLDHPGIVPVHEIGKHDGQYYFAMGFVDGESLAAKIAEGPLPPRDAAQILKQVAEAVDNAHQHNVIHRDLKPRNILIDQQGRPRVADFGLAKKVDADSDLTATGQVLGTPSYMPPEQTRPESEETTETADVYSLGATLYAVITGRPPFQGPSAWDTITHMLEQEPVAPRRLNAAIPKDLETICLKCLEKEAQKRYPSAQALADELQRFLNGEPIKARPVSRAERLWRWCRRNPRVAIPSAIAAVFALTLMIGGPIAAVVINEAKEIAEQQTGIALVEKQKAIEQSEEALESVTAIVRAVKDRLQKIPGEDSRMARREMTETALARLERVLETGGPKSIISAMALRLTGDTLLETGRYEEALEAYRKCLNMVESARDDPRLMERYRTTPWLYWQNLARVHDRIGDTHSALKQLDKALEHYRTAYEVRNRWVDSGVNASQAKQELAVSLGKLGDYHRKSGELDMAMAEYERALLERRAIVKERVDAKTAREIRSLQLAERELGGALRAVGLIHRQRGQKEKALPYFEQARDKLKEVLKAWQQQPGYDGEGVLQANIGIFSIDIGLTRLLAGESEEAVRQFRQALDHLKPLYEEDPRNRGIRSAYWLALYGLATSQLKLGLADSEATFQEARKVSIPESVGSMLSLARCHETEEAANLAASKAKSCAEKDNAKGLYDAAAGFALCAWSAKMKGETKAFDEYAGQAIQTLKTAIEKGYEDVTELKNSPEVDALRDMPEFREITNELEKRLSLENNSQLTRQAR